MRELSLDVRKLSCVEAAREALGGSGCCCTVCKPHRDTREAISVTACPNLSVVGLFSGRPRGDLSATLHGTSATGDLPFPGISPVVCAEEH